ncbi:hypothetical protein POM88_014244 [Heracleum sosnowskyi]|uniref:Uncharacterized protein n=1 Tax=Heracleum sosnowskyi TaxID=360622 RepID=A0AAD8J241_9APIA|nr:hypothetical protein POM88_014244 [Heracleum sosnowskyi]
MSQNRHSSIIPQPFDPFSSEPLESRGWFNNCYPRCARKVCAIDETFYCDNCAKETNDFKPRYKLIEAEHLIGVPVEHLITDITEGTTLDDTPPVIKNIVGKRCAFDVKINAYNTERGFEEFTVYCLNECVGRAEDEGDKKGDETTKKHTKRWLNICNT